ncbi:hypothetical protein D3C71_1873470 [compost metagenome]
MLVVRMQLNPACNHVVGFSALGLQNSGVGLGTDEVHEQVKRTEEDFSILAFLFSHQAGLCPTLCLVSAVNVMPPALALKAKHNMISLKFAPALTQSVECNVEGHTRLDIDGARSGMKAPMCQVTQIN